MTTPWVIYTRSLSAPHADLVKSLTPLPLAQSAPPTLPPPNLAVPPPPPPPPPPISVSQNSSFNRLLPSVCNDVPRQYSNKIPRLCPPNSLVEPLQTGKLKTFDSFFSGIFLHFHNRRWLLMLFWSNICFIWIVSLLRYSNDEWSDGRSQRRWAC